MKLSGPQQKKRKKTFETEARRLENEIKELKKDIESLDKKENDLFPSFKKFSNTLKTLSENYFELEYEAMIEIVDITVSNIFVHKGKVVAVQFKPPFDTLFSDEMSDGWKGKTGLETELKNRMLTFMELVRDMGVIHLMKRINEQVRDL